MPPEGSLPSNRWIEEQHETLDVKERNWYVLLIQLVLEWDSGLMFLQEAEEKQVLWTT
jgi:hypothetical protein